MGTIIDAQSRDKWDQHQRWDYIQRAALLEEYHPLEVQGRSPSHKDQT
jgi:hypothetical protein